MRSSMRWMAIMIISLSGLVGCAGQTSISTEPNTLRPVPNAGDLSIVTGQLVYVPAYGRINFPASGSFRDLTTTLAIHNTDLENPIIIRSVRYYDTEGALVREYIQTPVLLNPMATTGFVVAPDDAAVSWGANFLVEWVAEQPVYEPVIEALMYPNSGIEGISFISPGRVVSEQQP